MKNNLYIPESVIVGQQNRSDTFTKKLAYIVFKDEKGVLRKELSWNGWRDKTIEPLEIKNDPVSGFILNKGVQRYGYYGSGRSAVRVFDPRGFEFEISVDNLMFLLMHSDVSKQDILEKCIYSWNGKDLILLPVNSQEYEESVKYTESQSKKISAKSLVLGYSYAHKKEQDTILVYIGMHDWYDYLTYSEQLYKKKREHVFYNVKEERFYKIKINMLSEVVSENDDYSCSDLIDGFMKTENSSNFLNFELKNEKKLPNKIFEYGRSNFYKIENDNTIINYQIQAHTNNNNQSDLDNYVINRIYFNKYKLNKDGVMEKENEFEISFSNNSFYHIQDDALALSKHNLPDNLKFLINMVKEFKTEVSTYGMNNKKEVLVKRLSTKDILDHLTEIGFENKLYLKLNNGLKLIYNI